MRIFLAILLASGIALAQTSERPRLSATPVKVGDVAGAKDSQGAGPAQAESAGQNALTIPSGSKIPLTLAQAISTKTAREGDPVYAQTAFPFVLNEKVLVPAGTYIQGKISHVARAGRTKGRAEILMHFTSMIYPSGYTVLLPGSVENTPGSEDKTVKDKEGTIQQDKNTGKRIEDAAKGGAVAGTAGSIGGLAAGGLTGARAGGGAGLAAGVAWALLKRGPDVKLDVGTSIEMEIQRDVPLDGSRLKLASAKP